MPKTHAASEPPKPEVPAVAVPAADVPEATKPAPPRAPVKAKRIVVAPHKTKAARKK